MEKSDSCEIRQSFPNCNLSYPEILVLAFDFPKKKKNEIKPGRKCISSYLFHFFTSSHFSHRKIHTN